MDVLYVGTTTDEKHKWGEGGGGLQMFTPETNLSIVPHYMYMGGETTIYFIARSINAHTSFLRMRVCGAVMLD